MPNIYEQLGQEGGIRKAVDAFYMAVVTDPQLAHYFAGVDMTRLRGHQVALLCSITGGPSDYTGRDLEAAHAHLNITAEDFLKVAAHLATALEAAGASSASVDAIVGALAAHKAEIVTADTGGEGPCNGYGR